MIISIYDCDKNPLGVADFKKITNVSKLGNTLKFLFDNGAISICEFDYAPTAELNRIIMGTETYDSDVKIYNVKNLLLL